MSFSVSPRIRGIGAGLLLLGFSGCVVADSNHGYGYGGGYNSGYGNGYGNAYGNGYGNNHYWYGSPNGYNSGYGHGGYYSR